MAEVWVAASAIVSAGAGVYSARQASRAAGRGADAATNEQARQYDTTRADFAGQRSLGNSAMDQLARAYGFAAPSQAAARESAQADVLMGDTYLPAGAMSDSPGNKAGSNITLNGQLIGRVVPGGANGRFIPATGVDISALRQQQVDQQAAAAPAGQPDMGAFTESPDYRFNLAEGESAINRSLAARGRTLSGAGVKEGVRYASGMASGEFGNWFNRLSSLAGLGQAATQSTAAAGANAANNISQNHLFAGQSRANGYMQTGQAVNNAVQGGISNYLLGQYLKQQPVK